MPDSKIWIKIGSPRGLMKILDKNHHIWGDFGLDKNREFGHLLTQAFEGTFGGPLGIQYCTSATLDRT